MQDYIFAVGGIVFLVSLIPSIRDKQKPALSTSLLTGGVLILFALTYASLRFWFAAITQSVTAVLWLVLAYQRLSQNKDK